jgi:hypothetical protein
MIPQTMKPKKVGIIGEHPNNDAEAMMSLLARYKQKEVHFELVDVVKFRGSNMDNHTFSNVLAMQLYGEGFDYVIVLRDLDFNKDKLEKERIKDKDKWFAKVNKAIENIGLFFLIIYELEALMLCDLDTLNNYFKVEIAFNESPIKEKDPKGFLIKETIGKYDPSDASAIFKKLDFDKLYQQHTGKRSFQTFADELKAKDIIIF